ncbi:N-formyl peptide receptor 2-like [Leptodactylus fuscus]|uniref:N-formyl peptide receptor 2-like n=1 Tax=Leptodactylus fuscus TaxID=238119 RepID=UPI003F4EFBC3
MTQLTMINSISDITTPPSNNSDGNVCSVSSLYPALQIFRLAVYVIVYLLGTTGNALVIWFCIFRMVKTVNLVWILNLAIADFLFIFFLPLRITYFALDNVWPFEKFMCNSYWFLNYLNLSVSVLQLMVISLDRYICVHFPVWCKNNRRLRLAIMIVTTIWIVSILFNVPYFTLDSTSIKNNKTCCSNTGDEHFKKVVIGRFVCLFVVPFTIIVLCYTAITVQIRRKGMYLSSRPFKIFVSIIISFFICFFPYNLFLLLGFFGDKKFALVYNVIKLIVMCFVIIHSCINPIIYILIGRDFKEKFCTSFQTVLEKAFTENVEKIDSSEDQRIRENCMNSSDACQESITDFTE